MPSSPPAEGEAAGTDRDALPSGWTVSSPISTENASSSRLWVCGGAPSPGGRIVSQSRRRRQSGAQRLVDMGGAEHVHGRAFAGLPKERIWRADMVVSCVAWLPRLNPAGVSIRRNLPRHTVLKSGQWRDGSPRRHRGLRARGRLRQLLGRGRPPRTVEVGDQRPCAAPGGAARHAAAPSLDPEPLFDRSGAAYYRHGVRILAEAEAPSRPPSRCSASRAGRLRISAPDTFGWMHVAPAIPDFLTRFRELSVDIALNAKHLDLVDEGSTSQSVSGRSPIPRWWCASSRPRASSLCGARLSARPRGAAGARGAGGTQLPQRQRHALGQRMALSAKSKEARVVVSGSVRANSAETLRARARRARRRVVAELAIADDLRSGALRRVLTSGSFRKARSTRPIRRTA